MEAVYRTPFLLAIGGQRPSLAPRAAPIQLVSLRGCSETIKQHTSINLEQR
jgi:hypothetical protein